MRIPFLTAALCMAANAALADAEMAQNNCAALAGYTPLVYTNTSCANSWPGNGQVLYNIVKFDDTGNTNPQSSADIIIGNSIDENAAQDPVPTGRAGQRGTHFLFTANDQYLKYAGQVGDATSVVDGFAADWHKSTATQWSVLMPICFQEGSAAQTLFGTKATGSNRGVSAFIGTSEFVSLNIRYGTTGGASTTVTTAAAIADGACKMIGVLHNDDANETKIWIGATGETFSNSVTDTTSDPTMGLVFGTAFSTGFAQSLSFESAGKMYGVLIDDVYFTSAQYLAWVDEYERTSGLVLE